MVCTHEPAKVARTFKSCRVLRWASSVFDNKSHLLDWPLCSDANRSISCRFSSIQAALNQIQLNFPISKVPKDMEDATFQERVKYWVSSVILRWTDATNSCQIAVFRANTISIYSKVFTVIPFCTCPVLGIGPAAILQVMQCKEYRKRDKKMPSTKAWDANRNENKSYIQYVHVIFVWCLAGLHAVIPYHTQLVGKHCLFKIECVCCECEQMMTEKCHANHSPWTAVQPYQQSTIWPRLKCALATIERKAGKLRLHPISIDWSLATADKKRFGPSLSSLWKLVVNLLT